MMRDLSRDETKKGFTDRRHRFVAVKPVPNKTLVAAYLTSLNLVAAPEPAELDR
jgi:hypothetical protein